LTILDIAGHRRIILLIHSWSQEDYIVTSHAMSY
jgi:hypothetical protein